MTFNEILSLTINWVQQPKIFGLSVSPIKKVEIISFVVEEHNNIQDKKIK